MDEGNALARLSQIAEHYPEADRLYNPHALAGVSRRYNQPLAVVPNIHDLADPANGYTKAYQYYADRGGYPTPLGAVYAIPTFKYGTPQLPRRFNMDTPPEKVQAWLASQSPELLSATAGRLAGPTASARTAYNTPYDIYGLINRLEDMNTARMLVRRELPWNYGDDSLDADLHGAPFRRGGLARCSCAR